ncbi:CPXCG motif-containing cysteine-rich protein [Pelagicoccus sp. SDUM812002]|uniref:CPXCG motif-containing cysteine-rich protein n=1 Tax=Pelagicoccus sp. SDUM812002 TaxID=3041266 RepID=UPI0031F30EDD
MNLEQDRNVACPYCGESIGLVVDCTIPIQEFVEDCQVCCRPIQFRISVAEDGEIEDLRAMSEDE